VLRCSYAATRLSFLSNPKEVLMKKLSLLLALVAAPLFAAEESYPSNVKEVFEAIENHCAANGSGYLRRYTNFNAVEAMAALRAEEDESCLDQRVYSRSKDEGIAMFLNHIKTSDWDSECLEEHLSRHQRAELVKIITDKRNKGVLASLFREDGNNPEACSYWSFVIYRHDGVVVQFHFNHTD
jgi:hypothetical protein